MKLNGDHLLLPILLAGKLPHSAQRICVTRQVVSAQVARHVVNIQRGLIEGIEPETTPVGGDDALVVDAVAVEVVALDIVPGFGAPDPGELTRERREEVVDGVHDDRRCSTRPGYKP